MARSAPGEVDRLRREVERALRENFDAEDVLPMLARLARAADPESDAWLYAHRHLAEIGVEHDPWRAALFARRVLARRADDDGAWAVLGLAQSLLGNYRCAARAYERALTLAPDNPWYAHNLGHLYDVALDRPGDALPLLARATEAESTEADIAASYAHALARCGKVAVAKRVLKRAIRRGATADQMALWRWLDAGAPPRWTGRAAHDGAASGSAPQGGSQARPGPRAPAEAPHEVPANKPRAPAGPRAVPATWEARASGAPGPARASGAPGPARASGAPGPTRGPKPAEPPPHDAPVSPAHAPAKAEGDPAARKKPKRRRTRERQSLGD